MTDALDASMDPSDDPGRTRLAVPAAFAALVVLAVVGFLGVAATPAAAHGNHVSADGQVSANGTVVVENAYLFDGGYVTVHADDGGEPGAVVGHTPVDRGFHTAVPVRIAPERWRAMSGNATVWVVLHRTDGDGEFDPADDVALGGSFGGLASERITVRKGTAPAVVVAEGFSSGDVTDGQVTVDRVTLPEAGYLVVRSDRNASPGAVVGRRALPAGTSENVTVDLEESFLDRAGERFSLWAVAHAADGDGRFDSARDDPVTAGGEPVASRFVVARGSGPAVNTPTPGTATPGGTATTSTPTTGPGFGVGAAVLALAALLAGLAWRGGS